MMCRIVGIVWEIEIASSRIHGMNVYMGKIRIFFQQCKLLHNFRNGTFGIEWMSLSHLWNGNQPMTRSYKKSHMIGREFANFRSANLFNRRLICTKRRLNRNMSCAIWGDFNERDRMAGVELQYAAYSTVSSCWAMSKIVFRVSVTIVYHRIKQSTFIFSNKVHARSCCTVRNASNDTKVQLVLRFYSDVNRHKTGVFMPT